MSNKNAVSPYVRLQKAAAEFARAVLRPQTIWVRCFEGAGVHGKGWDLSVAHSTVETLNCTGYDAVLRVKGPDLYIDAVKRPPEPSWEFRP